MLPQGEPAERTELKLKVGMEMQSVGVNSRARFAVNSGSVGGGGRKETKRENQSVFACRDLDAVDGCSFFSFFLLLPGDT